MSLLRRLGITIPPSLDEGAADSNRKTLIAPVSGYDATMDEPAKSPLDDWNDPDRVGFAPTLDLPDGPPAPGRVPEDPQEARRRLGRFDVIKTLGRGGMGEVMEGYDRDLGRRVALKVARDARSLDEKRLARFVAEAQLTAQLEHPNIVPVHEFGISREGEGGVFYSMKKVDGIALADALLLVEGGDTDAKERWSRRRLLNVFVQICHAMAYAHERGVIHRDLKPDNVMLGEFGEVLVLDWGLARLVDRMDVDTLRGATTAEVRTAREGVSLTRDGTTVGTPGFMSPEQADGRLSELGPASDVWSLGAILYTILTGTFPHQATDLMMQIQHTIMPPVQDCRERAPQRRIPEERALICNRAVQLQAADRYEDAGELGAALEAFLEGARRKAKAQEALILGHAEWARHRTLTCSIATAEQELVALEAQVQPWTPVKDKKELLRARERLVAQRLDRARCFAEVVTAGERVLAHDPGNADARAFIAQAWWQKFEEAEARRDEVDQALYASRVEAYDDGPYAERLEGTGALVLTTDPPGAEVILRRYFRRGLIWTLTPPQILGTTPLKAPLPMGSYLLTITCPGYADTTYPVHITRGRRWEPEEPVRLLTPGEVGEGWVYVPAGPCQIGEEGRAVDALQQGERHVEGFLIQPTPVTNLIRRQRPSAWRAA